MLYTFSTYSTIRELYIALLKVAISCAVLLSVLVSLDRLWKVGKYLHVQLNIQLTGRKPEHSFQNAPLPDPNQYSLVYPRVAVQLPMFNERAVCQAIIDSACELYWPRSRFKVQVSPPSEAAHLLMHGRSVCMPVLVPAVGVCLQATLLCACLRCACGQ